MEVRFFSSTCNLARPFVVVASVIAAAIAAIRFFAESLFNFFTGSHDPLKDRQVEPALTSQSVLDNHQLAPAPPRLSWDEWFEFAKSHDFQTQSNKYLLPHGYNLVPRSDDQIQINVPGDGNCLFHSTIICMKAINHEKKDISASDLRKEIVKHLSENRARFNRGLRAEISDLLSAKMDQQNEKVQSLKSIMDQKGIDIEKVSKSLDSAALVTKFLEDQNNSILNIELPDDLVGPTIDAYLEYLKLDTTFAGAAVLQGLSDYLDLRIQAFNGSNQPYNLIERGQSPQINLVNVGSHYNALISLRPLQLARSQSS